MCVSLASRLFKAGVLTEQLLQALTKDQPKKLRAASSTTQTPTTAPGIVKYLYGDVQESGGDAVRFYADDVVYEDMNYDTPFVGKTAVEGFLNRFQDIEGVTFVLEEVSDGEKARSCNKDILRKELSSKIWQLMNWSVAF